ncbi:hypothetical protein RRG08_062156 [Elysia crispata]|uniref:Uncharacterized protein n=1 Tax=Elysia crispata TaxID=231223 RepID=A0AAE1DNQ1_9GAST|nr:hypothetical protein RRG08_062156 [Elysia crispata]
MSSTRIQYGNQKYNIICDGTIKFLLSLLPPYPYTDVEWKKRMSRGNYSLNKQTDSGLTTIINNFEQKMFCDDQQGKLSKYSAKVQNCDPLSPKI